MKRKILVAGDHFVRNDAFIEAIREAASDPESLCFNRLELPWPIEPFGPVGSVYEASGSVSELIAALEDASVVATHKAPFTPEVFEACPSLEMIAVSRGGPVNVDMDAATRAGVLVSFAPGRNAQAAAEFAVGSMLAAARHIAASSAELHSGVWRGDYFTYENAGLEINGTTVGLVGYGAIGSIVAKVLRALGARVLVYDPYANPDNMLADGVEPVPLDDLMSSSSIVSLHARLTPETTYLIDERRLRLLPWGSVLVNSARGALLDYGPLPALLDSGHLAAVALDVYDEEPPGPRWPLLGKAGTVLTPHLGGATKQTAHRAARIVAQEIGLFLKGADPQNIANPAVLEQRRSHR